MSQEFYKVVFRGEVAPDKSVAEVKQALASLMRARVFQLETLFSGKPIVVKKNLDHSMALKYVMAFQDIGAVAELKQQAGAEPTRRSRASAAVSAQAGSAQLSVSTLDEVEPEQPDSYQPQPTPMPAASTTHSTSEDDFFVETHNNSYGSAYDEPERPLLDGIVFLIKLILTLIFTGLVVAVLVLVLLWLTSGLEFIGIERLDQLPDRLRQLAGQLMS